MLVGLFIHDYSFLSKIMTESNFVIINDMVGLFFLGIVAGFFYLLYHRKISLMGCFTFLYLMGIVFWPVKAGTRYLLPIMAPMAIYLVVCFKPVWRKWAVPIFLFLILQNLFVIVSNFNFNDDDIYKKESLEMLQWVELHIKPEDNYMFSKPRALRLLTNRMGHNFWGYAQDTKNWYRRIKPLHINYLIVGNGFDQFEGHDKFCLRIEKDELYIKMVWRNNTYRIFKLDASKNSEQCPAYLTFP